MSAPIPLVLDTDPALGLVRDGRPSDVDDGFAIVEALHSERIELRGVTVTYGNAPVDAALEVARDLVRLEGADVRVVRGAARAMPQQDGEPARTEALEFLAAELEREPLSIAAIGPLTNLGTLLWHRPELARRIDRVVVVAGRSRGRRFYLGDAGPVRDFNFENDVRAARLLLSSGVPVVLAGFELSSQVVITPRDLERIRARGGETAEYLYRKSQAWCAHWTRSFPSDAGFHPWDSAAIGWLLRPELFESEPRGWRVRQVKLTEAERRQNPDDSPDAVSWLECDAGFAGPRHVYLTGFKPGGREAFVRHVVDGVY